MGADIDKLIALGQQHRDLNAYADEAAEFNDVCIGEVKVRLAALDATNSADIPEVKSARETLAKELELRQELAKAHQSKDPEAVKTAMGKLHDFGKSHDNDGNPSTLDDPCFLCIASWVSYVIQSDPRPTILIGPDDRLMVVAHEDGHLEFVISDNNKRLPDRGVIFKQEGAVCAIYEFEYPARSYTKTGELVGGFPPEIGLSRTSGEPLFEFTTKGYVSTVFKSGDVAYSAGDAVPLSDGNIGAIYKPTSPGVQGPE